MKMHFIYGGFLLFSLAACKPRDNAVPETSPEANANGDFYSEVPGLKLLWDSEKTLTTSESVLYDSVHNLLYVSCINGVPPDKKDNDGFIARVGLDGKIITQKWATGLSAPKGMGISGNSLYVTDIDRLVAALQAIQKLDPELLPKPDW